MKGFRSFAKNLQMTAKNNSSRGRQEREAGSDAKKEIQVHQLQDLSKGNRRIRTSGHIRKRSNLIKKDPQNLKKQVILMKSGLISTLPIQGFVQEEKLILI